MDPAGEARDEDEGDLEARHRAQRRESSTYDVCKICTFLDSKRSHATTLPTQVWTSYVRRPQSAGGRGEVFIRLLLSTEKDQTLTAQEHKHLLKILFANELQKSQCAPFKWNGEFSKEVGS